MKQDYNDILERIPESPSWYDHNGVPRYGAFAPGLSPNIYADQVGLIEIACQQCYRRFKVELCSSSGAGTTLDAAIQSQGLSYGDPPSHVCTGDSMNSISVRVVEFWRRGQGGSGEFSRIPELEIPVRQSWADDIELT